jgi:hypothetical protein
MRTKTWIWLIALAACGGKGEEDKPLPPFEPPLTVAKVMKSDDVVKPLQAWDKALAKLQAAVGPPTKVEGDKHFWAAMEGDDCAYFYVSREDGKEYGKSGMVVGVVQSPGTYNKDGALMNRAECLELVGKGVPEDPNAAPPRTDGAPYEVAEVAKLAVDGRATWKGQKIKVTGVVTQTMGDEVMLADGKNAEVRITCKLAAGTTAPEPGKPVVVEGTVAIREFVRGTGEPGMEAELENCAVLP